MGVLWASAEGSALRQARAGIHGATALLRLRPSSVPDSATALQGEMRCVAKGRSRRLSAEMVCVPIFPGGVFREQFKPSGESLKLYEVEGSKMKYYCVNKNAQQNGDHEVHAVGCSFYPAEDNRIGLGQHQNCSTAVLAAQKHYSQVNGCYYCANACHTQ